MFSFEQRCHEESLLSFAGFDLSGNSLLFVHRPKVDLHKSIRMKADQRDIKRRDLCASSIEADLEIDNQVHSHFLRFFIDGKPG